MTRTLGASAKFAVRSIIQISHATFAGCLVLVNLQQSPRRLKMRNKYTFLISLILIGAIVLFSLLSSGCVMCRNTKGHGQYSYCSVIGQSGNVPNKGVKK